MEKKKNEELMRAVVVYGTENEALMRRHGLAAAPTVHYARRGSVPLLGRLAMWLLRVTGATVEMRYSFRRD